MFLCAEMFGQLGLTSFEEGVVQGEGTILTAINRFGQLRNTGSAAI